MQKLNKQQIEALKILRTITNEQLEAIEEYSDTGDSRKNQHTGEGIYKMETTSEPISNSKYQMRWLGFDGVEQEGRVELFNEYAFLYNDKDETIYWESDNSQVDIWVKREYHENGKTSYQEFDDGRWSKYNEEGKEIESGILDKK